MAKEAGTSESAKTNAMILEEEILEVERELHRPASGLLLSGLTAGFGVGIGIWIMAVVATWMGEGPPGLAGELVMANAFTLGFIAILMARTDLFTEFTTSALLPVLRAQSGVRPLVRLWALVYVANLAGACAFAALLTTLGPGLGHIEPRVFGELARPLIEPPSWAIVLGATLAGWLMGMLSWLLIAAKENITQVLFIWVITLTLGIGPLHHSISGSIEVLAGVFSSPEIGVWDYGRFIGWTTLGNTVGGVIFALMVHFSVPRSSGSGAAR